MILDHKGKEIKSSVNKMTFDQAFQEISELISSGGLTDPYKNHHIVQMAINVIATNVARVPLVIYHKGDEKQKPVDHPVLNLFKNPNPLSSRFLLWEGTSVFFHLRGEAIWLLSESVGMRAGTSKIPSRIWCLDPQRFKHIINKETGDIVAWKYQVGIKSQTFLPENIIHFKRFNPYDAYRGLSPIKSIQLVLDSDYDAQKYNRNFFKNNATPGGLITIPEEVTNEEAKRLISKWKAIHRGSKKAHNIGFLQGGMDYKESGLTQVEMAYLESRKYGRDELFGVFGVPSGASGFTENVNYANMDRQMRNFWTIKLIPMLTIISEQLNSYFLPSIDPNIQCKFDLSNIEELKEDLKEKIESGHSLWSMGVPFNDINKRLELGMPEIEGGEIGYLPMGVVPVGEELTPEEPEDEEEKIISDIIVKDITKDKRSLTLHRNYLKFQNIYEKLFHSKMKRYFFEQRKLILSKFPTSKGASITGISESIEVLWTDEDKKLVKYVLPIYRTIAEEGIKFAFSALGIKPTNDQLLVDPLILKKKLNKIVGINKTVYNQIKNTIAAGVEAGETISDIESRIRKVYNMATTRASTIARTESGGLINETSYSVYNNLGVSKKQWIGGRRPTHAAQNGMIISMKSKFPNGLMYPGDSSGGAAEVCNCTCTIAPVVK